MPVSRSGVSGSSSVVVPQESTEPFTAFDVASRVADIISGIDQQVFQSLMISFLVIV